MNKKAILKYGSIIVGGLAFGALGMEVYNGKKYSSKRNAAKFFNWLSKNVYVRLARGDYGLKVGETVFKTGEKNTPTDDEIDFNA